MVGPWRAVGAPAMVSLVGMVYWDDSYVSAVPTTHSDGGDRSERVHGITRTKFNVNDLQVGYST